MREVRDDLGRRWSLMINVTEDAESTEPRRPEVDGYPRLRARLMALILRLKQSCLHVVG